MLFIEINSDVLRDICVSIKLETAFSQDFLHCAINSGVIAGKDVFGFISGEKQVNAHSRPEFQQFLIFHRDSPF